MVDEIDLEHCDTHIHATKHVVEVVCPIVTVTEVSIEQ